MRFQHNYKPKHVKDTTPAPTFTPGYLIEAKNIKRGDIVRVVWSDGRFAKIVSEYQASNDGGTTLAHLEGSKVYRIHEAQPGNIGFCGEDLHTSCKELCTCECHFQGIGGDQ